MALTAINDPFKVSGSMKFGVVPCGGSIDGIMSKLRPGGFEEAIAKVLRQKPMWDGSSRNR